METEVPVGVVAAMVVSTAAGGKNVPVTVSSTPGKERHPVNPTSAGGNSPALILRLANPLYKCPDSFYQFYLEQRYTDMTFSCIDGYVACHKVVMAASSTYFEQFLKQSAGAMANNSMAVAIHQTKLIELKFLLEFIYTGEIKFSYPLLDPILAAGMQLQINSIVESQYYLEESSCSVFAGLTLEPTSPPEREDKTKGKGIQNPPVLTKVNTESFYYTPPISPFLRPENEGKTLALFNPWTNPPIKAKVQPVKGKNSVFNTPDTVAKPNTGGAATSSKKTKKQATKQKPEAIIVSPDIVGEMNASDTPCATTTASISTSTSSKRKKQKPATVDVKPESVDESNIQSVVEKTDTDTPNLSKKPKKQKKPVACNENPEIVPTTKKRIRRPKTAKTELEKDKKPAVNQKNISPLPPTVERIINQVSMNIPRPFQELDPACPDSSADTSQSFRENDSSGVSDMNSSRLFNIKLETTDFSLASDTRDIKKEILDALYLRKWTPNVTDEFKNSSSDQSETFAPKMEPFDLNSPVRTGNIAGRLDNVNKENNSQNTNEISMYAATCEGISSNNTNSSENSS